MAAPNWHAPASKRGAPVRRHGPGKWSLAAALAAAAFVAAAAHAQSYSTLRMPDFREYALPVPKHGAERAESTRQLGKMMRDIYTLNRADLTYAICRVLGVREAAGLKD